MLISQPPEKKDAVPTLDGILTDQETTSINKNSTPKHTKIQHNAFKILNAKGVVFTHSLKNALKQLHECRFNDCYRAFICPIEKKDEVQSFLSKCRVEAELVDIFSDLEKSPKVEGLEMRLSIIDQEIHKSFNELITQAHQYDPTRS